MNPLSFIRRGIFFLGFLGGGGRGMVGVCGCPLLAFFRWRGRYGTPAQPDP